MDMLFAGDLDKEYEKFIDTMSKRRTTRSAMRTSPEPNQVLSGACECEG